MKKTLLSIFTLFALTNLNSQIIFTENFSGNPFAAGWTVIDADNDGMQWQVMDITGFNTGFDSQGGVALSASLIPGTPGYTPDNMIITPNIDLSAITGGNTAQLTFKAGSDMSTASGSYQEHITVYAVTGSTLPEILAATPVLSETLTAGRTMLTYTVNLNSFAGQTIKIVFRHHNCTDESAIFLDDVNVSGTAATAITLQCGPAQSLTYTANGNQLPDVTASATASTTCAGGAVTLAQSPVAGTIMANGANTVTVTATDNCGNTQTCTTVVNYSDNVGVNENSLEQNGIYPNPTTGKLNLTGSVKSISVADLSGKIEFTSLNPGKSIDVSSLKPGIYLVEIKYANDSVSRSKLHKK
ncbi:MAG: hypothetical protein K0R65_1200 [Crocinitomicaceae bacterium]|jgi:hypothetical protein|nr:hypothetical protein [Crocinitomicaceae bacterium]